MAYLYYANKNANFSLQFQPVFELRKNKWLSHGQPGYNFWLSVHVFGCAYLEYMYKGDFWLQIYGCPLDNCIGLYGCPVTFLVVPGARTTKILNADSNVSVIFLYTNSNHAINGELLMPLLIFPKFTFQY